MEPDKETPPATESQPPEQENQAPADALSRTPDDLETEQSETEQNSAPSSPETSSRTSVEKKISPLKRFFRRVNLYILIFMLLIVVAGIVTIVNYLNSQKPDIEPGIETQQLTEDALKQLANNDATIGDTSQTLTIQGNAIIAGQSLMRGDLNVAGNLQTGGSIQGSELTIPGTSNLSEAQIDRLQVASDTAIQGSTTLRDLTVAGTASFNGAVTVSQITATRLILSGNAELQVPNHISFTGPSPSRTLNAGVVGNGGSVSVSGSDTAGTININTGGSPSPGCFARINFQRAFTNNPHVLVGPIGKAAGQTQHYVERTRDSFSICTSNAAPANQAFAFDYFVTN